MFEQTSVKEPSRLEAIISLENVSTLKMEIRTLKGIDSSEILEVFNESFSANIFIILVVYKLYVSKVSFHF